MGELAGACPGSKACQKAAWQGDGCCGINNYNFCTYCLCLDPESFWYVNKITTAAVTQPPTTKYACDSECAKKNWVADTFCDDANNNCGCDWDGGDCCGDTNNFSLCTDCTCQDPDD